VEVWDVVVVGAGPAGSSAAHAAATAGASTLVLDAFDFPRYKTCGGGLIGVSSRCLEGIDGIPVRDEITAVSFSKYGGRAVTRRSEQVSMRMVNRADFDHHLLRRAIGVGATFRPRAKVTSLEEQDDLVVVTAAGEQHRARAVVGADGSAGRTARHVGVEYAVTDLGLEVELEAGELKDSWRHRVHLDWGRLPGSYGWVFPKDHTLTVGVIAERGRPDETRAYLTGLVEGLGLDGLDVLEDSGHLTRCREDGSPLFRGRVLVAGDAAGLLEPWTREGISFALRSGALAGSHAAALARGDRGAGAAYAAAVESDLGEEVRAGFACRAAFTRHPGVFHTLLSRTPVGWRSFLRIVSGDTTLERAMRHRTVRGALQLLR